MNVFILIVHSGFSFTARCILTSLCETNMVDGTLALLPRPYGFSLKGRATVSKYDASFNARYLESGVNDLDNTALGTQLLFCCTWNRRPMTLHAIHGPPATKCVSVLRQPTKETKSNITRSNFISILYLCHANIT